MKSKDCGNRVNMNEKIIEQHLIDGIDAKMQEYRLRIAQVEAEQKGRNLKAEISAVRAKLSRLNELFINDFISMEEYRKAHTPLTAKLEALTAQDRPSRKPDLKKLEAILAKRWKEDYEGVSREEKREFWRMVIKEIRVYPDRRIEFDLNI